MIRDSVRDASRLLFWMPLVGMSLTACVFFQEAAEEQAKLDETQLREQVSMVLQTEFAEQKGVKVHPHVRDRAVLLTGNVELEEQKVKATTILGRIGGLSHTYNELVVGPPTGIRARVDDTIIQNKVRLAFLNHKEIPNGKMDIVVRDNVVYLIGRVSAEESTRTVEVVEQISGVEKVVALLETGANE